MAARRYRWRRCGVARVHGRDVAGASSLLVRGARDSRRRRSSGHCDAAVGSRPGGPAVRRAARRRRRARRPPATPADHSRCGSGRRIERPATGKPPRSRRQRNGGRARSTSSASPGAGPRSEFEAFIDEHGLTFPQLSDGAARSTSASSIPVQPALVVIDGAGEVETLNGSVDERLLDEVFAAAVQP